MYHKEKSIQIKNSASALYNNLSVLRIAPRRLTYFTVVHANVVNMVSASWDGLNYSHRQLQSKEPNVATSTSLIMQVCLILHVLTFLCTLVAAHLSFLTYLSETGLICTLIEILCLMISKLSQILCG